jgi:hypothetical protein
MFGFVTPEHKDPIIDPSVIGIPKLIRYEKQMVNSHQMNVLLGKIQNGKDDPNGVIEITSQYSLYNLRDTVVTGMANNNLAMSLVQELMNHCDSRVNCRH